jgi:hypothetical protein
LEAITPAIEKAPGRICAQSDQSGGLDGTLENLHGMAEIQDDTLRGTLETGEAKQGAGEFSGEREKKDKVAR